jgi:acetoin utilization protein AcuB
MLAQDLITDEVPPIKSTDSGEKAIKWMDEFKVSHLPVVDGIKFLGLVSDSDLLDMNQPEAAIGEQLQVMAQPHVTERHHIYDVIRLIASRKLTLVPVLDDDNNYVGAITLSHLMTRFSGIASINDPGGILVLEMSLHDYSMMEMGRIVEGNDAKILSSYITSSPDSMQLEVTLKINKEDLSAIMQTFTRYNYTIKASFQESSFKDDLKTRYDELMNYINM